MPMGRFELPTARWSSAVLISCFLTLQGCASVQQSPSGVPASEVEPAMPASEKAENEFLDIMVDDLFSAFVQVLPPKNTTVQVSAVGFSGIHQSIARVVADKGYGIQKVSADQGSNLLSSELMEQESDNGNKALQLRISIGPISLSRSYEQLTDDQVRPMSGFNIYGSRASIDMALTTFGSENQVAGANSDIQYRAPVTAGASLPTISLITPEIVQQVVDQTAQGGPGTTTFNSAQIEVNNLFYGESSFGSVLDSYEPIERLVVIFPNDSIALGGDNKLLIRRFTERFVENYDLINVVGCSNGPTASELGNVGLALGRAERVTNELLDQGIPRTNILDEGCWAPQGNIKDYPGRGVVMELWRENL